MTIFALKAGGLVPCHAYIIAYFAPNGIAQRTQCGAVGTRAKCCVESVAAPVALREEAWVKCEVACRRDWRIENALEKPVGSVQSSHKMI